MRPNRWDLLNDNFRRLLNRTQPNSLDAVNAIWLIAKQSDYIDEAESLYTACATLIRHQHTQEDQR